MGFTLCTIYRKNGAYKLTQFITCYVFVPCLLPPMDITHIFQFTSLTLKNMGICVIWIHKEMLTKMISAFSRINDVVGGVFVQCIRQIFSMGQSEHYKKDVTPLLTHCNYVFLPLTHRFDQADTVLADTLDLCYILGLLSSFYHVLIGTVFCKTFADHCKL